MKYTQNSNDCSSEFLKAFFEHNEKAKGTELVVNVDDIMGSLIAYTNGGMDTNIVTVCNVTLMMYKYPAVL